MIRVLICLAGVGFLTLALGANAIGLSQTPQFTYGQFLLVSVGVVIFLIGTFLHTDKQHPPESVITILVHAYKKTALIITSAFVLFVCADLGASIILKYRHMSAASSPHKAAPKNRSLSYYASHDWREQYWDEFASADREQYYPYIVWRRASFAGKFININRDGLRTTPGARCQADSYKIFAFGGSGMWGSGSPDWSTIPAYLQSGFEKLRNEKVCVMNFGESGFVSTQGVIQLLLLLQSGNVPHLVIFYDGINDVYAAYESGKPGVHEKLPVYKARFHSQKDVNSSGRDSEIFSSSFLVQILSKKLARRPHASSKASNFDRTESAVAELADSVTHAALNNYKIVAALGEKYNFQFFFFWQPVIAVGKKTLTSEELPIQLEMDPSLVKLYDLVYRGMEAASRQRHHLYYLAHIFDDRKPLVWIDFNHVIPEGNQLIAQEMLRSINPDIARN